MLKIEHSSYEPAGDPAARFATEADLEIADWLRHRIEERYFSQPAPAPRPAEDDAETH